MCSRTQVGTVCFSCSLPWALRRNRNLQVGKATQRKLSPAPSSVKGLWHWRWLFYSCIVSSFLQKLSEVLKGTQWSQSWHGHHSWQWSLTKLLGAPEPRFLCSQQNAWQPAHSVAPQVPVSPLLGDTPELPRCAVERLPWSGFSEPHHRKLPFFLKTLLLCSLRRIIPSPLPPVLPELSLLPLHKSYLSKPLPCSLPAPAPVHSGLQTTGGINHPGCCLQSVKGLSRKLWGRMRLRQGTEGTHQAPGLGEGGVEESSKLYQQNHSPGTYRMQLTASQDEFVCV